MGWWESLGTGARILFYAVIFLVIIIGGSYFLQRSDEIRPRRCPRCGAATRLSDVAPDKQTLGGRELVRDDFVKWTCPDCGWSDARVRGAPIRKYHGPW